MEEESKPDVLHTVPPNIDGETWAKVQQKWAEVEERKIDAYLEFGEKLLEQFSKYYLQKTSKIAWPVYILVGISILASAILTGLGKMSGETFAFLMGTVVGYLISVLSKHT